MPIADLQARSNYNEAFTLLKETTPEQRLDVQLPFDNFVRLDQDFSELESAEGISEDQRFVYQYPSLTYNSLTQTATVVTCQSNIHEGAARWFDSEIREFIKRYPTRSPHTLRHIRQSGSTTQFPDGQYRRSRKEADASFVYEPEDQINGMGVNVVILVCFRGRPRFRYPDPYQDITDWRAERATMASTVNEAAESNRHTTRLLNHTWIGELNEAFTEAWQPNSHRIFYLIKAGRPHNDLPDSLGLRIRDFYPRDVWEAANIEDSSIPFDSAGFLDGVMDDVKLAAKKRFRGFLLEKLNLGEDGQG
ncbi:hypothetical protein V1517DRAFT_369429 [Lipomyces orientalis]|uniref:Uncharacterized protein n=1 Tax=Lipomyces orientalis TaxID=1233043 RepID=A0ACC3TIT8_9ASCO